MEGRILTTQDINENLHVDQTLYTAYCNMNSENRDGGATRWEGERYTHGELIELTDTAAAAFVEVGVKKRDKVGLVCNGSIYVPVFFLALNKIGAVSKWIDPEKSGAELADLFIGSKIKVVVCDYTAKNEIMRVNEFYKIGIETVILTTVGAYDGVDSFGALTDVEFMRLGYGKDVPAVKYEADAPALIISTSGSTDKAKCVVHTNRSVNCAARKMFFTDYGINRDKVLFQFLPIYIGMSLITTMYTGLLFGAEVEIVTDVPSYRFGPSDYLERYKENPLNDGKKLIIFSAPIAYRLLMLNIDNLGDLSFVHVMMAGGAKIEVDFLERFQAKMKEHGCDAPLCNGYGQNEQAGSVTLNQRNHNVNGSAGICTYNTWVKIVDPDSHKELGPMEVGMIIEQSDAMFQCYENDEKKTFESKLIIDGEEWFNPGDYGYFDEEGNLFIVERASRIITITDFKFPLSRIESIIHFHPAVEDVAVVAVDVQSPIGMLKVPVAYVILKQEYKGKYNTGEKTMLDEIQQSEHRFGIEAPQFFVFVDSFKLLSSGKPDYAHMTQFAQTLINFANSHREPP